MSKPNSYTQLYKAGFTAEADLIKWREDRDLLASVAKDYGANQRDNNEVDKPKHYIGENGLEVEEVLRNFIPRYKDTYIAHRVASAIEYLLRSPLKNGNQDIEKAAYNLQQALTYIEALKDEVE